MASDYESFWTFNRYAVVGHSARRPFARITYQALKDSGKTVYAVDPSAERIEGDAAFPDLTSLPDQVDGVVLELPREETATWLERAIDAGVKDIWIHQNTDTPEALTLAREHGIRLRTGTCAVMYLRRGFTFHSIHRWVNQLLGKY
jgi:predicted CoA-binding protein